MRRNDGIRLWIWSLLTAVVACNAAYSAGGSNNDATFWAAPHPDPAYHVDMKKSVEYLASDALEGRLVGTPGLEQAADYIADSFSKLGLQTLPGLDGYFQHFEMVTRVDPDPEKSFAYVDGKRLALGEQFIPLRSSAQSEVDAPVVFAGYGIDDPARHYSDYTNLDAKGKIVLVMRFEPHKPNGESRFAGGGEDWSVDATIAQKVRVAAAHGAVGILLVNPPLHHDDEGLIPFSRRDTLSSAVPLVQITPAVADEILRAGGAKDLKSIQSRIDQSAQPQSAALNDVSVRMSVGIKETKKRIENVAGILPGKGDHAEEYVIVGAHYDHLGHGGPGSLAPWSHGIHHGADDNASGTTAMMELADRFAHLGPQKRSIIFIAFTAEEEGLIGSQYFASHPPVPLKNVVAMLNLDMVGRMSNGKLLIGGEGTAEDFPELMRQADKGLPLVLSEFGKGGIGPSDHTSFALKKIPVLFFFTGLHMDYHRPTDTSDKINYKGMEEVVDLGQRVMEAMTTMPREKYNGKYDASGLLAMAGPSTRASNNPSGSRASMGAIPDYSQGEDAKGGMRIGGIMPGSPAEKAGLRQGDFVAEFNGTKINNMMDYTAALATAKPGQTVAVKILRDGKPMEVQATLVARKE
jgi:hypothetical protein